MAPTAVRRDGPHTYAHLVFRATLPQYKYIKTFPGRKYDTSHMNCKNNSICTAHIP